MKKCYYVYIDNRLYYDNFTRAEKLKLNKIITSEDIVQTYQEGNTIFVQLDHLSKKVLNIVYGCDLEKLEKMAEMWLQIHKDNGSFDTEESKQDLKEYFEYDFNDMLGFALEEEKINEEEYKAFGNNYKYAYNYLNNKYKLF